MGRKLKRGVLRTKSGRISRAKSSQEADRKAAWDKAERDAMGVVLDARERQHGLTGAAARDQLAGSFIGRLCLSGRAGDGITRVQYDALVRWEEIARAHAAIIQGPMGDIASDPNRVGGISNADDERYALRIAAQYRGACAAIQERQNQIGLAGNLFGALYACVQRDRELHHLVGELREAANALARHYGMEQMAAA